MTRALAVFFFFCAFGHVHVNLRHRKILFNKAVGKLSHLLRTAGKMATGSGNPEFSEVYFKQFRVTFRC